MCLCCHSETRLINTVRSCFDWNSVRPFSSLMHHTKLLLFCWLGMELWKRLQNAAIRFVLYFLLSKWSFKNTAATREIDSVCSFSSALIKFSLLISVRYFSSIRYTISCYLVIPVCFLLFRVPNWNGKNETLCCGCIRRSVCLFITSDYFRTEFEIVEKNLGSTKKMENLSGCI